MLGFLNGIKGKNSKHIKYPLQANIRMQTRSQMHAFECNTPQARGSWSSVSSVPAWFTDLHSKVSGQLGLYNIVRPCLNK